MFPNINDTSVQPALLPTIGLHRLSYLKSERRAEYAPNDEHERSTTSCNDSQNVLGVAANKSTTIFWLAIINYGQNSVTFTQSHICILLRIIELLCKTILQDVLDEQA